MSLASGENLCSGRIAEPVRSKRERRRRRRVSLALRISSECENEYQVDVQWKLQFVQKCAAAEWSDGSNSGASNVFDSGPGDQNYGAVVVTSDHDREAEAGKFDNKINIDLRLVK